MRLVNLHTRIYLLNWSHHLLFLKGTIEGRNFLKIFWTAGDWNHRKVYPKLIFNSLLTVSFQGLFAERQGDRIDNQSPTPPHSSTRLRDSGRHLTQDSVQFRCAEPALVVVMAVTSDQQRLLFPQLPEINQLCWHKFLHTLVYT